MNIRVGNGNRIHRLHSTTYQGTRCIEVVRTALCRPNTALTINAFSPTPKALVTCRACLSKGIKP